eukprot:9261994-Alexandrium_andersonii.AAC.1
MESLRRQWQRTHGKTWYSAGVRKPGWWMAPHGLRAARPGSKQLERPRGMKRAERLPRSRWWRL